MRDLKLPSYEGLYGRAFLPPVMIVSIGRWGSRASSRFFRYLADAFPDRDLSSCFVRIAVVRDGVSGYELGWEEHAVTWPEVAGDRLPLAADTDTQEEWGVPRSGFESASGDIFKDLANLVTHGYAWLDAQEGWRHQADEVGLKLPGVAQNPQHWIAIVGNIFEPEVATLLVRFVNEFQCRPPIINTDCRYLFVVDAGLPDEPGGPVALPWVDMPAWLAAEAVIAIDQLRVTYPAIAYFLSEKNRAGRTESESGRAAIAGGLLRAFFCSELLDRKAAPNELPKSDYWNEIAVPQLPGSVGMERVAHFLEIALDAENLRAVAAREAMSRWRSSIGKAQQVLGPDAMKSDVLKVLSEAESVDQVYHRWLTSWTTNGVLQSDLGQFETLLSWMDDEQRIDDLEYKRLSSLASVQPQGPGIRADDNWWNRLKHWLCRLIRRLLGFEAPAPQDYAEDAKRIRNRMENREKLCARLKFGSDFFGTVHSKGSPFEDTKYDKHYCMEEWDQRTIVLRLKRLPLQSDCPPEIQRIVAQVTSEMPELMVRCSPQYTSAEAFTDQIQSALAGRFKELFDRGDATERWTIYGFSQWLAKDPQLAQRVAEIVCERFIIPWDPIAGHEWQGHLAILSFELPGNHNNYDSLRTAWEALARELRRGDLGSRPLIGSPQPAVAEFSPDSDLLWIRWPQILSLGFLWFESNALGQRFAEGVDYGALRSKARGWLAAHAEDHPRLMFSLPQREPESTDETE